MNNFVQTFGADGNNKLIPLPLQDTTNGAEGTFQFTSGIQDTVAQITIPDATPETTNEIDQEQSKREHAELIASGATGVQICQWAGEKFGQPNWARGEHHGEWSTLSTPEGDLTQLKAFLKQGLGIDWSRANGGSDNHAIFHLTDGYALNALFGTKNMKKADARNDELHREWQRLGTDYEGKAQLLKQKVGLDIKGDWSKLTGVRYAVGGFDVSDGLCSSGSLYGDYVRRLWLDRHDSDVSFNVASGARLCFLA